MEEDSFLNQPCVGLAVTSIVAAYDHYEELPDLKERARIAEAKTNEVIKHTQKVLDHLEIIKKTMIVALMDTAEAIRDLSQDVDFLATLAKYQPSIANLVSITYLKFARAQQKLQESAFSMKIGKALPIEILQFMNSTDSVDLSLIKHSKMESCRMINDTEVQISFSILQSSNETAVNKADAFQFYNESNGMSCLHKYSGPEHILFNLTADCMTPLKNTDINDGVVRGVTCSERQ